MPWSITAAAASNVTSSGIGHQHCCRDDGVLGIRAASHRVYDSVARLDLGDLAADPLDRAGAFASDGGRPLSRIEARPVIDVDEVDAADRSSRRELLSGQAPASDRPPTSMFRARHVRGRRFASRSSLQVIVQSFIVQQVHRSIGSSSSWRLPRGRRALRALRRSARVPQPRHAERMRLIDGTRIP